MKFRKKPVVIEAVLVNEALHNAEKNWKALPEWLRESYEKGDIIFRANSISIKTLEGTMMGDRDDWIICGVKGELYPCKPDIFEATYEPISKAMPDLSETSFSRQQESGHASAAAMRQGRGPSGHGFGGGSIHSGPGGARSR